MKRDLFIYVAVVVGAAAIILAVLAPRLNWADHDLYLIWFIACFAAEQLWLSSITGKGSHSMASTFNFVVIALLSLPAAVWIISLNTVAASFVFQKREWYRAAFNGAQMTFTTVLSAGAFHLLGGDLSKVTNLVHPEALLAWVAAGVIYHGMNTGLVAGAIALQGSQPWTVTWRENFGYRDELMSSVALFLMSPIALAVYLALGPIGLVLFYVPLLFIRNAHARYIELVRAQEALVFNERMAAKGDIAAKIAHDLDNFLAPIMGRAQMLILDANRLDPDKVARYAQIIFENVANMKILTKGLSNLSYAEVQMMRASLTQLVRQTVEFVRPQNKFQAIHFDLELDESLPQVHMDPAQIQNVLMNLLSNAADALGEVERENPRIRIRTSLESGGKFGILTVSDNGPGIAPENVDKIFEPRFSTKGLKGHGFGLASCFNIIQRHGGKLTVTSRPGEGATFQATIPVHAGR